VIRGSLHLLGLAAQDLSRSRQQDRWAKTTLLSVGDWHGPSCVPTRGRSSSCCRRVVCQSEGRPVPPERQRGRPFPRAPRAAVRLRQRFRRLTARGKHPHVAVTAIARARLPFMWAIAKEVPVTVSSGHLGLGSASRCSPSFRATLDDVKRRLRPILVPRARRARDGSQYGGTQSTDISRINRRSYWLRLDAGPAVSKRQSRRKRLTRKAHEPSIWANLTSRSHINDANEPRRSRPSQHRRLTRAVRGHAISSLASSNSTCFDVATLRPLATSPQPSIIGKGVEATATPESRRKDMPVPPP
jgi:hypothetical protein